jgi:hypothetical protein
MVMLALNSSMLRQMSRSVSGSSAEVTSSRISSFGSPASARASAIRWRCPPDSRAPFSPTTL